MKYLADLSSVGFQASFETTCYLLALKEAAQQDAATGSARLLGHAYVRYVGGVFGEAALSKPYRTALGLSADSPKRLSFGLKPSWHRRLDLLPSLEPLYATLDLAGELLAHGDARAAVVEEAEAAARCNLHLHQEGAAAKWLERSYVAGTLSLGL